MKAQAIFCCNVCSVMHHRFPCNIGFLAPSVAACPTICGSSADRAVPNRRTKSAAADPLCVYQAYKSRVRVHEFFRDYDKLRSGTVTVPQVPKTPRAHARACTHAPTYMRVQRAKRPGRRNPRHAHACMHASRALALSAGRSVQRRPRRNKQTNSRCGRSADPNRSLRIVWSYCSAGRVGQCHVGWLPCRTWRRQAGRRRGGFSLRMGIMLMLRSSGLRWTCASCRSPERSSTRWSSCRSPAPHAAPALPDLTTALS